MPKLPNPGKAIIRAEKLEGYCLNPEHQDGQHKARVFKSVLNLGTENAEVLRTTLLNVIRTRMAIPTKHNHYGQKYIIDLSGKNEGDV